MHWVSDISLLKIYVLDLPTSIQGLLLKMESLGFILIYLKITFNVFTSIMTVSLDFPVIPLNV